MQGKLQKRKLGGFGRGLGQKRGTRPGEGFKNNRNNNFRGNNTFARKGNDFNGRNMQAGRGRGGANGAKWNKGTMNNNQNRTSKFQSWKTSNKFNGRGRS